MTTITCIEDLRVLAQKRVPRMFYDYADSGSWTEGTYRANESDFHKIKLRQRVAVNMENRTLATTMIGVPVAMPVALAPTGLTGMQHADGEILAARAAEKFGVPFTLSTMSICSIEDIAAHTQAPFWFQLYMMRDRGFIERLIERAPRPRSAARWCSRWTCRSSASATRTCATACPRRPSPRSPTSSTSRPSRAGAWACWARSGARSATSSATSRASATSAGCREWTAKQFDPALSWADVEWVKKRWGGKLILKGIMDVEDARLAASPAPMR